MNVRVKAKLNYLRISPRKMRLLADYIRGKKVANAKAILNVRIKKGALPMKKLLESAIANAKNNFSLDESSLIVSEIFVDEGPKLKRWHAMSRGRAFPIQKKTSHITIVLEGLNKMKAKKVESDEQEVEVKQAKEEKDVSKKNKNQDKKFRGQQNDTSKQSGQKGLNKVFRRKVI